MASELILPRHLSEEGPCCAACGRPREPQSLGCQHCGHIALIIDPKQKQKLPGDQPDDCEADIKNKLPTLNPHDSLAKAWELMVEHKVNGLIVEDENGRSGYLSEYDLLKNLSSEHGDLENRLVGPLVTPFPAIDPSQMPEDHSPLGQRRQELAKVGHDQVSLMDENNELMGFIALADLGNLPGNR